MKHRNIMLYLLYLKIWQEENLYDNFLGTYDSFYWYNGGSSLRAVREERIASFDTEGSSGICGGRHGSGFRVVAADTGYGYVGEPGEICLCACSHRIYSGNWFSAGP